MVVVLELVGLKDIDSTMKRGLLSALSTLLSDVIVQGLSRKHKPDGWASFTHSQKDDFVMSLLVDYNKLSAKSDEMKTTLNLSKYHIEQFDKVKRGYSRQIHDMRIERDAFRTIILRVIKR